MPLKLAAMLCAPSPAVTGFCRDQSSSVVLSQELASTGAFIRYLDDIVFVGILGEIPVSSVDDYGDNL